LRGHPGRLLLNLARIPLIQFLLLVLVSASSDSCGSGGVREAADETQQLRRKLAELKNKEQTLAAEYALARNAAPYLVVNLSDRTIQLKARGRSLRSFTMAEIRESARGKAAASVWTLEDKKPLEETERPKITPGAGEEATAAAAKQALWGVHRMPSDYDLICDGNRILQFRALPARQSGLRIVRWARLVYRRTADWYRRWSTPESSRPRYSIQLWMSEDDSRLLFWSLPKQVNILLLDGLPVS
jgi:hypothetical protein